MRASLKIRKFKNSYFLNRLGGVKISTKLYIFLIWQNIILFKIFLGKLSIDFLFILAIRSIAQPELLLIDSQGTLMIYILIQTQI